METEQELKQIEREMEQILEDNIETTIVSKQFRDTRTGEVVTQIPSILEIGFFEEVKE